MMTSDLIKQSTITLAKEMTEVAFVDEPEHQPHHNQGGNKGVL